MKRTFLGITLLLCAGLTPVMAEPPTEAHEEAALELLDAMEFEASMLAGAEAMVNAMIQQNPQSERYRDVILEWAGKVLTWERFAPSYVEMYTEAFTEKELREIATFYRTPTGKKTLELMPRLMQKGAALGMEVANQNMPELQRMIEERDAELEGETGIPQ